MSTDPTWPITWFRDPGLTEATPLTVTPDGRVFGHLCEWDRAHIGFGGRKVFAPRGDDMRFFLTGATDVRNDDGEVMEISVGKLTMNTGHASIDDHVTAAAASAHYDNTGSIAALINAGSDAVGIWMAGAMMPDLDAFTARRFRCCGASGDWRPINGSLRLVAALSVPVGGFPIPRARVASGAPMALVAAGALAPPASFGRRVDPTWESGERVAELAVGNVTIADAAINSLSLGRITIGDAGEIRMYPSTTTAYAAAHPTPSPADMADLIAARLDERRQAGELSAAHAALVAELDDTPAVVASLLAEVDDTPEAVAALLADLGGDADPKELSV